MITGSQIDGFAFEALNSANDGITIVDINKQNHPLVYINPSFEKLTGYSAKEVIGKNCSFLQEMLPKQIQSTLIREAIYQQKSCTIIIKNIKKDGTLFWNELSLAPIKHSNKNLSFYIGIQKDVTKKLLDNKAIMNILEQNKKEAMHLAISHLSDKLAQPLTAISMYSRACCYLMENRKVELEEIYNPLKKIEVQTLLFNEIMNKINTNFNESNFFTEEVDLNELLLQIVNPLKYMFSPKIQLQLDPAPLNIRLNSEHISQIILNLILNSIEAFQRNLQKDEQIVIKTIKFPNFIEILISDNGTGMPKEYKNKELLPFFTQKNCGIGTGFEICKKIIHMYRGNISLQENFPGLTVSIKLPIGVVA